MFRLPRNSFEFNTDPNKGIDYILSAIRALQSGGGVTSFNTRTGAVTLTSSDVTTALGYTPLSSVPTLAQVTTAGNTTTNNVTVGSTFIVGDWTSRPTNVYVRAATGGAEERGYYIGVGSTNTGNGGSLTYNPTTNLLSLKSPYNSGTTALSLEGNTNSVQFHNTSGTVVSKFVSSTGNLLINTTTDAGYKLDVNGTARVQGATTINNRYLYHQGDSAIQYFMTSNAWSGTNTIFFGDDSSSTIGSISYNHQFDSLSFNVNGSNALFINSSRNVGIGTSSPIEKVDITTSADNQFALVLKSTSGRINFKPYLSTTYGALIESTDLNRTAYNPLTLSGSKIFMLDGNVLINTTTDAGYKLDVVGSIRASSILFGSQITNTNSNPVIGSDGSNIALGVNFASRIIMAGTNIDLQANSVAIARFASSNAGVYIGGTTTPTAKLQVGGSITATSALAQGVYFNNTLVAAANNDILVGLDINPTFTNGAFTGVSNLALRTQSGNVIFNGGNVGIGTTAPESPLHVKYSSATVPGITIENDGVGFNAGSMTLRSGTSGGVNMSATSSGGLYWFNLNTTSNTLSLPATGNLIVGGAVDAGYRLDVKGGNARFEQNVEAASYSVAGNAGYSGIINFPGNPPGSQNLEFLQGILINVF